MKQPNFPELLKQHGFKATPGRVALLHTLWHETQPISIPSLAHKLRAHLNEATLYRALEALIAAGVIRRVDLGHSHTHVELQKEHHHHIVCTVCGTVEDIESATLEKELARAGAAAKRFITIQSHSVEFFGTCRSCTA